MGTKFTRHRFLTGVSAGVTYLALKNTVGCELPKRTSKVVLLPKVSSAPAKGVWAFRSRPDLSPPALAVTTQAHRQTSGYIFVAPNGHPGQNGSMILDTHGQLVWFYPPQNRGGNASAFKTQSYRGEPVLTWAEGKVVAGHGITEYVILDGSYQEITRVRAGNGYRGDLHEFLITPEDTALMTIYNPVRRDLSPIGGSKDSVAWEGIVQEVDIETGEVLFEWHSLDHVGLDESYGEPPKKPKGRFDYFHINSIDVDHDGNLLVGGHKTFTVYKVDHNSGKVLWRLGGKKSDFEMGPGTRTRYQHDARRQPDGTITIFDNSSIVKGVKQSRGIVVELDEEKMTATLVREYTHPDKYHAATMGNMQVLPNGNVFIGWGNLPGLSKFNSDGELIFDAKFPPKVDSYRAFCFPWSGHPSDRPVAVAERASEEEVRVYASWNGATQVTTWEVLAGPSPNQLESLGSVRRDGFETAMLVRTAEPYVVVRPKDRSGRVLGATEHVQASRSTS